MVGKLVTLSRGAIQPSSGNCYVVKALNCGRSDSDDHPGVSSLRLFEEGVELGPPHSVHVDIVGRGGGRFSHWKNELLFSSSDNSSCAKNGRLYQVLSQEAASAPDGFPVSSLPKGALLQIQRGIMRYQYRGIDCFKCPFDLAIYQRLLWDTKPRTILEFGTWRGGSALWFADVMTAYCFDCHVHSFDISEVPNWNDPRITFHQGDVLQVAKVATPGWISNLPRPILVIDDAGHDFEMTTSILRYFGPLLRSGEYLIVEDGVTYEMGSDFYYDGGPRRALVEFLTGNKDYVVDRSLCDYFGENVTWNVNGYLRRL